MKTPGDLLAAATVDHPVFAATYEREQAQMGQVIDACTSCEPHIQTDIVEYTFR